VLGRLDPDTLPDDLRARYLLYSAQLAFAQGDTATAEALTSDISESASPDARADAYWLLADIAARTGRLFDALNYLDARQALVEAAGLKIDEQREIWALIEGVQPPTEEVRPDYLSPWAEGWLSLATVAWEAWDAPWSYDQGLRDWRATHPDHPAAAILGELRRSNQARLSYPDRIGVLLPLSGRLAPAGRAIRDGLMAAFEELPAAARPTLRFFDTGPGVSSAYYGAVDWDADMLVGPLTKEGVDALYDLQPTTPVLALNYLPEDRRPQRGFFQYALAPEDEARQAARRAIADGAVHIVALIPDSEIGTREVEAFREELEAQGGLLVSSQAFDPASNDYSTQIMRILGLDRGRLRHQRIRSVVGLPLEFESRRRQDVDAVFVVADSRQGRLIRPQLRFHHATQLPVYATSSIHDDPETLADRDMDGIMFLDMPWILGPGAGSQRAQAVIAETWPREADRRTRLHAMGFDAFRLIPVLVNQDPPLARPLPGATGVLSLDGESRVQRELEWATFRRGVVVAVPDASER
jgi:outer membrane PBP1 activator LpoA protein